MKKFHIITILSILVFSSFIFESCSDGTINEPSSPVIPDDEPIVDNRVKVLFIGNSYTGYFDMPGIFEEIANSEDKEVFVDKSVTYNKRLPYFFYDSLTMAKIHMCKWDYVIFQQAQYLTDAEDRWMDHFEISVKLDSVIHSNCAATKLILFMEQAYSEGDHTYDSHDSFEEMTSRVVEGSLKWAELLGKPIVSPVAAAWAAVYDNNPEFMFENPLHDAVDGCHPTLNGAYVTACTFYTTIFKEPIESDYNPGIDDEFLRETQEIVSHLVLDNREKWNIP